MKDTVFIETKAGLRMEVRGNDSDGQFRIMRFQLDRVYAQLLARRLLQLAGNDKEFPDPTLGKDVFATSLSEENDERIEHRLKYRGSTKLIKVSRR